MSHKNILWSELGSEQKVIHIVMHDFPDPDSIASAMGVSQILRMVGKTVGNIYYTGEVSHPQNRTMITLLGANIINYVNEPFEDGSDVVVVDTNGVGPGTNQHQINPEKINLLAIIDHHKSKHVNSKDVAIDSRQVGACSSIVWEYLEGLKFDFSTEVGQLLSTALVTGIFTDTQSLQSDNISTIDFKAYQDLLQNVDKQKLKNIMNYPLPSYLFELRQKAFMENNQQLTESMIVSGIGIIKGGKRDALPIIADELLRMSGIQTSIVFAIVDDNIDISIRSNDVTLDVGHFAQTVFGAGGGKRGSGRALIPLGFFKLSDDEAMNVRVWEVVKEIIFDKIHVSVKGD